MSAPSTSGLSVEVRLRVIDVKYGYFTLLFQISETTHAKRTGSPRFADFLLGRWSESVFLALFNRKAYSGDKKDSNSECCRLVFIASGA